MPLWEYERCFHNFISICKFVVLNLCRGLDSISFISAELSSRHYLQYLVQFIHVKRNPLKVNVTLLFFSF